MKKSLLIIFGGASGEHKVSCISAASVLSNIQNDKYDVIKVGITEDGRWIKTGASPKEIETGAWADLQQNERVILSPDTSHHGLILQNGDVLRIDVVFPVMHGKYCEDGCIQGLFEMAGIPYVGSGVFSSAVAMDKSATKLFAANLGVLQADWMVIQAPFSDAVILDIVKKFSFPLFIKPCNAGSSLGVSKVSSGEGLKNALLLAAKYDSKILCEEFIDGQEVECALLGNEDAQASAVGEIAPSGEFYDYNAKYIDNASKLIIPAGISPKAAETVQKNSLSIYKALGCRGLSRIDFFVHRKTGAVYFNEVNTLPGFTSISMYPKLWEYSGVSYPDLIDRLIEYAVD